MAEPVAHPDGDGRVASIPQREFHNCANCGWWVHKDERGMWVHYATDDRPCTAERWDPRHADKEGER
jgi:hypothetical protein